MGFNEMNEFVRTELQNLRQDFVERGNEPFDHFYCPILYQDEDTELCEAHIINKAFEGSTRQRTVQRADVDTFYGSRFEADFIDIASFNLPMHEIVRDPLRARRFNTTILRGDVPVEHFNPTGELPEKFSRVILNDLDQSLPFGLKMEKTEVIATSSEKWEIEISRDVRLPMLVSTIKAAHLSLFKLLGYGYVLSASGRFVGRTLLGEFFLQNRHVPKRDIVGPALEFFGGCVHMVRPVISTTFDSQGTVSDRKTLVCMGGSGVAWAVIVFVKAGERTHGVMVPTLQDLNQVDAFFGFLSNPNSTIRVSLGRFEDGRWEVLNESLPMNWPKDGSLLSDEISREGHS